MALCAEISEREATVYSAEGTVAHYVREMCLEFDMEPDDFVGMSMKADGFSFEITEEMADNLRPGIERIRERPGKLFIEYQVNLDRWMPGQYGKLDVGIVSPSLIEVNDLKYGAGMPVSAERNEQLMAYALGFWENVARHISEATEFLLVVDQPRARGRPDQEEEDFDDEEDLEADEADQTPGWGGEWRVSLPELLTFGDKMKDAYDAAISPDAWLRAGPHCQFCPRKGSCDEQARYALSLLQIELHDLDPDVITLRDHGEFTAQQKVNLALNIDRVTAWMKAVYASILGEARAGGHAPGAKVVEGSQGPRKWRDEKAALAFMQDYLPKPEDAFAPAKPLSPAKFEKIKGIPKEAKAAVNDHVVRSPGKPALVRAGDSRRAIDIADEFDDDDEDDVDDLLS
jgi:hypothetical protein